MLRVKAFILASVIVLFSVVFSLSTGISRVFAEPAIAPFSESAFVALEQRIRTTKLRSLEPVEEEVKSWHEQALYPYLEKEVIRRKLHTRYTKDVQAYLERYNGTAVEYPIRSQWLDYLAKTQHVDLFLDAYEAGLGSELTCSYLRFDAQKNGINEKWLEQVQKVWLSPDSQPKECDWVFRKWQQQGRMTDDLLLQRIKLSATRGDGKLIPYLKRKLPSNLQQFAQLWRDTQRKPQTAARYRAFPNLLPDVEAEIISYGLSRLAWRDQAKAIKAYRFWQNKASFTKTQKNSIERALALSLALDGDPKAREWLELAATSEGNAQESDGSNNDVKRWQVAFLAKQQDWQTLLTVLSQRVNEPQDKEFYQYWRARSLAALGNQEKANELYAKLATTRHYYGFLASTKLNQPLALQHKSVTTAASALALLEHRPEAQRAKQLLSLQRYEDARREWRYLLNSLSSGELNDAAALAYQWGWYDQAILTFNRSGYRHDVEKRFPVAYEATFFSSADQHNIEPALAFAIARRESSFMSDAVSRVGARGLMQLMPSTARYIAGQKVANAQLYDPEQNIDYGVRYMRYLLDKLDNQSILATAAYNAGWRNVLKWLPETEAVDADIWIENIPFKETRNYVKSVFAYKAIYEQRLQLKQAHLHDVVNVQIPTHQQLKQTQTVLASP